MSGRKKQTPLERFATISDSALTKAILGTDDPREYADYLDEYNVETIYKSIVESLRMKKSDEDKVQLQLTNRARRLHYLWNSSVNALKQGKKKLSAYDMKRMEEVNRVGKIIERQHEISQQLQATPAQCHLYSDVIVSELPVDNVIGLIADSNVPYGQLWIPAQYLETIASLTEMYQSFVGARLVNRTTGIEITLSVGQEYTSNNTYRINPHTRELLELWSIDGLNAVRHSTTVEISLVVSKLITEVSVITLTDDENIRNRITPKLISFKLNSEANGMASLGLELPAFNTFIRIINCKCSDGSTTSGFVKGLMIQEYTTTVNIL